MPVTLRPQLPASDRPAQVEDRERGEAEGAGAFRRPDSGLKRQRIALAGESRRRGEAIREVNLAQVENVK